MRGQVNPSLGFLWNNKSLLATSYHI